VDDGLTVRLTHGFPRRPTMPSALSALATSPNVAPLCTMSKMRFTVGEVVGSMIRRVTGRPR
jgi:hypothetical protein